MLIFNEKLKEYEKSIFKSYSFCPKISREGLQKKQESQKDMIKEFCKLKWKIAAIRTLELSEILMVSKNWIRETIIQKISFFKSVVRPDYGHNDTLI